MRVWRSQREKGAFGCRAQGWSKKSVFTGVGQMKALPSTQRSVSEASRSGFTHGSLRSSPLTRFRRSGRRGL